MRLVLDPEKFDALTGPEAAQARLLLEEYVAVTERNPLQGYHPASVKHHAAHTAPQDLRAIFGGNRSGKTTWGVVDDLIQATPAELLPASLERYKRYSCPFYCRIMTPDLERTMKPVIWQKLRDWCPKDLLRHGDFDRSLDEKAMCLRLECGCRFDFLSYEMRLNKFGGAALHRCHYDEAPPEPIRNECFVRLTDFCGDEIFTLTPLEGLDWTYRKLWKNRSDPRVFVMQIAMEENERLSRRGVERLIASMDEDELETRRHGRFFNAAGMVYGHRVGKIAVPVREDAWLRAQPESAVAIDPGIRRCGIVFAVVGNENEVHVYETRELRDADVPTYAREIRRVLRAHGLSEFDTTFIIDPAARARQQTNAETVEAALAREGIYATFGQNDMEAGVIEGRKRMDTGGLTVAETERAFLEEAEDYALAENEHGEYLPEKNGREHRLDAARYLWMHYAWEPDAVATPSPFPIEGVAYANKPRQPRGPGVMGAMA